MAVEFSVKGIVKANYSDSNQRVVQEEFKKGIREKGWEYCKVPGDGYCLFHAAAVLMGRENEGIQLLEEVINHMMENSEEFSKYMEDDETIHEHIRKLRRYGWGGEPELRAISNLATRSVEIWTPGINGSPTLREPYVQAPGSIKLAYFPGNHYDALVEGIKPILVRKHSILRESKIMSSSEISSI